MYCRDDLPGSIGFRDLKPNVVLNTHLKLGAKFEIYIQFAVVFLSLVCVINIVKNNIQILFVYSSIKKGRK